MAERCPATQAPEQYVLGNEHNVQGNIRVSSINANQKRLNSKSRRAKA